MEFSEAFILLENEVAGIGMIDAWGYPQDPAWAFALMEKAAMPDSETLTQALGQGLISPQEYYDHMLPLVRRFRVEYLAARSAKRLKNKIEGKPAYRETFIDEEIDYSGNTQSVAS